MPRGLKGEKRPAAVRFVPGTLEAEQAEIKAIVASTRADIVV
jgi:hypothetical protein